MTPGQIVEAKPRPGAGGWRRGVLVEAAERACVVRIGGEVLTVRRSRVREIPVRVPGRITTIGVLPVADMPRTTTAQPRAVPKPRAPLRSRSYLDYVREHPCCGCGAAAPSDAHHYGARGVGQRTDDFRTVPLCRRCHDDFHETGSVSTATTTELSRSGTRALFLRVQVDLLVEWLASERVSVPSSGRKGRRVRP